jgi:hypothetical protein
VAVKHTVVFDGQFGNMAAFEQRLRSLGSAAQSSLRSAASSPISNLKMPNISMGNVTSQIDSYNRVLTQSGQVFHSYVTGYRADIRSLETASRSLGTGGTAFTGAGGAALSKGTSVVKGKAGVYAKDYQPVYAQEEIGTSRTQIGLTDRLALAQRALIPLDEQLLVLDKKRTIASDRYSASLETATLRAKEVKKALDIKASQYLGQVIGPAGTMGKMYTNPPGTPNAGLQRRWLTVQASELSQLATTIDPTTGKPIWKPTSDASGKLIPNDRAAMNAVNANNKAPHVKIQRALEIIRGTDVLKQEVDALAADYTSAATAVTRLNRGQAASTRSHIRKREKLIGSFTNEIQAFEDAKNAPLPIGRDLDQFLAQSKGFRKKFSQAMGMQTPYTPAAGPNASAAEQLRVQTARDAFSTELVSKGVNPDSVSAVYDYERGLYKLTGTITDAEGRVGSWNTTLDKNGREIDKNNNSLGRHQGMLRQTGKDFQKVIEWTVATTLVFGAMGAAIGSISKINQVNKDLTRFALTAKTTGAETKQAFQDIIDIAYKTATPLAEMTAVMDDIALATRRANQTSSQWLGAQKSLAEAVGIFTNITGVDTVRATDLLSAAYKQLGILPNQIIPVLNKVTAVAGGNAQAIEDIAQALGSVSEAAKAAGLSVDEQISSVQVLSQVTNKSAADVATSFKNLFGAISSPGSVKALAKFNIPVRDAEGQLRHFLDIYKDIYDAKKAGRISEGELQDVLRGIAGGPRRAPDAAALLEAIPLIFEQITKAAGATNEALIANARVLTTNSAKLQQLRTQFDAALIQTFTDSVNKLVSVVSNLGKAFSGITANGELLAIITQFALITLGAAGMLKMAGLLKGGLIGLRKQFEWFGTKTKITGNPWFDQYMNPTRNPVGRLATPIVPSPVLINHSKLPTINYPLNQPSATPVRGILYPKGQSTASPLSYMSTAMGTTEYPIKGYRPQYQLDSYVHRDTASALAKVTQDPNLFYLGPGASLKQQIEEEAKLKKAQVVAEIKKKQAQVEEEIRRKKAIVAEELRYRKSQLLGTNKGRMALGVAGGLAVGGALAAGAAGGLDLGTLSSVGQGAGMALMFSGAPPIMAFGAALTGVSLILSKFNEDQLKTKEASDVARVAVYDQIGVLKEQRTVLNNALIDRDKAAQSMDEISKRTVKSTDDLEKLSTAQTTYLDSIFAISAAQKQIAETTLKLTSSLSDLDSTYKELAKNARTSGYSSMALLELSSSLASGILGIKDPGVTGYKSASPLSGQISHPDTIVAQDKALAAAQKNSLAGMLGAPAASAMSGDQFFEAISKYSSQQLLDLLNAKPGNNGLTDMGVGGAVLNTDTALLIKQLLAGMQEQVKAGTLNADEYNSAVKEFGRWVQDLYSPRLDLSNNISSCTSTDFSWNTFRGGCNKCRR